ncbi:MAG: ABC transporter permease [Acidimicrobiales bacterium]
MALDDPDLVVIDGDILEDPAPTEPLAERHRRWLPGRGGRPYFSGTVLALFVVAGAIGPYVTPYDPEEIDLINSLSPPVFAGGTSAHLLGTDQLGRDVLSRLIDGARVSLLVSLAVVVLAGFIGVAVALAAGYLKGRVDSFLMRTTDANMAFPALLLAIVIVGVFGPSTRNVIIVLVFAGWPQYARVLRSEVLSLSTRDFVTMSNVMGAGPWWIIRRHLLPNIASTLLVLASLQVGLAIIAEGSLSFLGIGVPPPAPSWGGMLSEGRQYLGQAWWLPILPGIALSATVLAANMMGDWIRVHNDPTTRR